MRRSSKAAQEHQRAGGIQRACGIVIEKSSERRTRSLARENNSARASERHVSHASNGLGTFMPFLFLPVPVAATGCLPRSSSLVPFLLSSPSPSPSLPFFLFR